MIKAATAWLALVVAAGCASTPEPSPDELWRAEIAEAARAAIEGGPPSIQIAIGQEGEVVFEAAYGLADVENAVPATTETLYRTASISKWMTATAAMALVEAGKLDLDAPIQRYCPAFPTKPWTITTRHLLSHTSGIRHYTDYAEEHAAAQTEADRAEIELRGLRDRLGGFTRYTDVQTPLETFKDDPLLFEPGTDWSYSSHGYRVLGCVLEGADGARDYRSIMQEDVFGPAGADILDDDAYAIIPHRASGYTVLADGGIRRANMRDVSENLPAGGHLATAGDLARFALAFHAGKLIEPSSIELMKSRYIKPDGEPAEPSWGHGLNYLGIYLSHGGEQPGASGVVMLGPERGDVIAVLCNADAWPGLGRFLLAVVQAIGVPIEDVI